MERKKQSSSTRTISRFDYHDRHGRVVRLTIEHNFEGVEALDLRRELDRAMVELFMEPIEPEPKD